MTEIIFDLITIIRLYCHANEGCTMQFSFVIQGFLSCSPFRRYPCEGKVAVRGVVVRKAGTISGFQRVYLIRGSA